jgi:SAM-dependent methyltransferase
LDEFEQNGILEEGIEGISGLHVKPYLSYYSVVEQLIGSNSSVLEIGAGTGRHTGVIAQTGARVTALDISDLSLQVLRMRTSGKVDTLCASMDSVPVADSSFDFIVSAGALSYADFEKAWKEIKRLLKPGESLIVLDTLNHNPVYRINRFLHFLMGRRTFLTLRRMPKMAQINRMRAKFFYSTLSTFGELYWIQVILKYFVGFERVNKAIAVVENTAPSKWGFKFLLVAKDFQPKI